MNAAQASQLRLRVRGWAERLWLNGSIGCGDASGLAGSSATARMRPRAFAQNDRAGDDNKNGNNKKSSYSTVTLFARFLG